MNESQRGCNGGCILVILATLSFWCVVMLIVGYAMGWDTWVVK